MVYLLCLRICPSVASADAGKIELDLIRLARLSISAMFQLVA